MASAATLSQEKTIKKFSQVFRNMEKDSGDINE